MKLKTIVTALLIASSLGGIAGCATPSVITLKDGRQIQTKDTPKLDADAGFYRYQQLDGKDTTINKDDVLTIKEL